MRPDSLPTAGDLQTLADAYRRDPLGVFVQLGNCLLALGRPTDAIEIGQRALQQDPNHLQGNLMMGVAYSQLHQWKDAQAQLLKVVKADRQNGHGFRLLGEVLLRRNDYERALPVLQHAQNLAPSDPDVLSLVQLARGGQPLGPPQPIPVAMQPAADAQPQMAPQAAPPQMVPPQMAPPQMAPPQAVPRQSRPSAPPPQAAPPRPAPTPAMAMPAAPMQSAPMSLDDDAATLVAGENGAPPRPLQAQAAVARPQRPTGAPAGVPQVRPRVIPAEKPKDAAQKGLRGSAAVGEEYLNELLVGGLLDVPNVRVSPGNYDVSPGKQWGRSSGRMFIYLFVILISAAAGSGVWYWYTEKQMKADVEKHLAAARALVDAGDQQELKEATQKVELALQRDASDPYVMAVAAEVIGLSGLLYGDYPATDVQRAITAVNGEIDDPSDRGYRELVIARAALTLSELYTLTDGADIRLTETMGELQDWLKRSPEDHLAQWLRGRAYLAAGNLSAAKATFTKAHANGKGSVMGTIDLANMELNNGDSKAAMKLYDDALSRSQNHPLAFVGRSLARSDLRGEPDAAIADINIGLARASGPKLLAWKELATAGAQLALEDYETFASALDKCATEGKPRDEDPIFIARIAIGRVEQGRIADAAKLRREIRWFGADPQLSPMIVLLDAELLLARGLPLDAIDMIKELVGVRAESIRGRALFDQAKNAEALLAFEKALKLAPDDIGLQVWAEASRMMSTTRDARRKADEALDSLGRKAQAKTARFVHGRALAVVGNKSLAQDKLLQSVTDISGAAPNALAYRSYLELARLAYKSGKSAEAGAFLDQAVELNPGYLPINDLYGQVLVDTDANKALLFLEDVRSAEVASVGAELAYARALVKTGGSAEEASNAIRRAQKRGAKTADLQKVITEVNPGLFEELGVEPIAE